MCTISSSLRSCVGRSIRSASSSRLGIHPILALVFVFCVDDKLYTVTVCFMDEATFSTVVGQRTVTTDWREWALPGSDWDRLLDLERAEWRSVVREIHCARLLLEALEPAERAIAYEWLRRQEVTSDNAAALLRKAFVRAGDTTGKRLKIRW